MLTSVYLRSDSSNPPLRVGLLLDSLELPICFAEIVDHIQQSNFARLELLVLNTESQSPTHQTGNNGKQTRPRSKIAKLSDVLRDTRRRRRLLFDLYERWDRGNIDPLQDPHAPVDCSARLSQVERIPVCPLRKGFVHRFPPDVIEQIRARELDVLIRFGFNILRGDILTAARYGVWSYHHGDGDYYRGGPPHFWEVYEDNPISGAMLQVLNEELDAGKVLCKGIFATYPGISRTRNSVQPYWGASTYMIQKLRELHQYGWEHVGRNALAPAPYRGKKKIYRTPSNAEMLRWLGPTLIRKSLQRMVRRPKVQHWRLAIRSGAQLIADGGAAPNLDGFRMIESPRGHFWADPFLIERNRGTWLFFEDWNYDLRRAGISCAEVRNGALSEPVPVLERPYSLSYPCVFMDGSEMYMIPETGDHGAVELYRCVRFPDRWELEKELFKARAVDTTVWIESGQYWFFTTLQERRGFGTQLWLFWANGLTGEWHPHPANPISTDVRNSRGGGAVFQHNGRLLRPSQDDSRSYGYSFSLNEIVTWDSDRYEEKPTVTVEPVWAPELNGTHTYSQAGNIEVIDGCASLLTSRVCNSPSHNASIRTATSVEVGSFR